MGLWTMVNGWLCLFVFFFVYAEWEIWKVLIFYGDGQFRSSDGLSMEIKSFVYYKNYHYWNHQKRH